MKRSIIALVFVLISLSAFTESPHFVRYYYDDGVPKAEGWVNAFQKTGYWYLYYPNGVISSKGHYQEDMRSDYWYFYELDGKMMREGHYTDGEMSGWWLYYDQQGQLDYKCQLVHGQKHGYCLKYEHENLVSAVKYENGKRIKEWFSLQSFKRENNLLDLK